MIYLRLLWALLRLNIANELAYPTNFFVQLLQSLFQLGTALASLAIIFAHTRTLGGWRPDEILALLGIYLLVGAAINLMLQPSMQRLISGIQQGTFDYVLIKPVDAQALASMQRINLWSSLDMLQGLLILVIALQRSSTQIGIGAACRFVLALLASAAILYSFWLLLATCAFWVVRVESMLAIFQNVYQAGRWPLGIYPPWLRVLLTIFIPVGLATTVPAEALLGHLTWPSLAGMVVLAITMLLLSRWFWKKGIRKYSGASA